MAELSVRARELTRAGRNLGCPTLVDRVRIEHALRVRFGSAVLPLAAGGMAVAGRAPWQLSSTVATSAAAFVGASVMCGIVFSAYRKSEPLRAHATPTAAISTNAAPTEQTNALLSPSAQPPSAPSTQTSPARRTASDRLAKEVALLGRATSSLHAGHPEEALKALDDYRREFPHGLLTEELHAARVQALCQLGRRAEARVALGELKPDSLAAARAEQICGGRSGERPH